MKKAAFIFLLSLCFVGFARAQAPCVNETVNNFSGTSGATPTAGSLEATQYGNAATITVFGALTYQTGAYSAIPDPTGVLCSTAASYAGSSSTTGLQIPGTGTNSEKNITINWAGNGSITSASASWQWCPNFVLSSYSGANSFSVDQGLIKSNGGDYANMLMVASNGTIKIGGESIAETPSSTFAWGTIVVPNGSAGTCGSGGTAVVTIQLFYGNVGSACTNGSSAAAPCDYLRILDYRGKPIACTGATVATSCTDGFTVAFPSSGSNTPNGLVLGNIGSQDTGVGNYAYFNWPIINFNGIFPVAHSCIAASASSSDVQTAVNNCQVTGGYVDIPAGTATWSSQVSITPTGSLTTQGATVCTGGCSPGSGGSGLAFTDNTVITLSDASGALNITGCSSSSAFCRLTNLSFINGTAASHGQIHVEGTHGQVSFRLDHFHFTDSLGTSGVMVSMLDGYGLVDHFLSNNTASSGETTPINIGGDFPTGGTINWQDATNFGSNQSIIIEDSEALCTNGCSTEGFFDGYQGGKVTIRNSIINGMELGGCHGSDTAYWRSCVLQEFYNLQLLNCPSATSFGISNNRGGGEVFWGNTVTGSCSANVLQYLRVGGINPNSAEWGVGLNGLNWSWTTTNGPGLAPYSLNASAYQTSHTYAAGSVTTDSNGNCNLYTSAGGTTSSAAPACPSYYNTVTDTGGVVWQNVGGTTAAGAGAAGWVSGAPDSTCTSGGSCTVYADGNACGFRDQPGCVHNQALVPIYAWSNTGSGLPNPIFTVYSGNGSAIVQNTNYFNNTAMPGYVPYTYPDPLTAGGVVATPTFSPPGGGYTSAQTVTISCATPSAIIYYTLDGSLPNPGIHGSIYSTPITVSSSETIQAVGSLSGLTSSNDATAIYYIGVAPAPQMFGAN